MKFRIGLLLISIVMSLCMLVYGAFYSQSKVYDSTITQSVKTPFYDWLKETEIVVATTFGGIRKTPEGQLFRLYSDLQQEKKTKKFCPT